MNIWDDKKEQIEKEEFNSELKIQIILIFVFIIFILFIIIFMRGMDLLENLLIR